MDDCKLKANSSQNAADSTIVNADEIKLSKISTIFFDLDNTLIQTRGGDLRAIRKLAELLENQYSFTKDESHLATQSFLKSFRRCPDNSQTSLDSWRTYLWREALPNRYKYLADEIYPKWLQLRYRYLSLTSEYIYLLRRFHENGYFLALITNGPSNAQWEKIKKLKLNQYFDCILVSSDLPWEKPNPNIFYAACNFLGVQCDECVMIGDKIETDIKGGCLAKLGATFWIPLNTSEINFDELTFKPSFILKNLGELQKYLPTHNLNATSNNSNNNNNSNNTNGITTATTAIKTAINNITNVNTVAIQANGATMGTVGGGAIGVGKCVAIGVGNGGAIGIGNGGGVGVGVGGTCFNFRRRRSSQLSCSATSTCDSDIRHRNYILQQYQTQKNHQRYQQQNNKKYKRSGSLPSIEYLNSETENSSDSLFS